MLEPGITALLGPNGAGKSTLIKILTGVLKPTKGFLMLDGQRVDTHSESYRSQIGYVPQQHAFYGKFTVVQYLSYVSHLKGIPKKSVKYEVEKALELVHLMDVKDKLILELSGGMKKRAMIAQAILSNPSILIMDEPTASLDPEERIRIKNIVAKMLDQRIVLIATHIVSDIERIADRIVLIDQGKIVGKKGPTEWMDSIQGKVFSALLTPAQCEEMESQYLVSQIQNSQGSKHRIRLIHETSPGSIFESVYPSLEEVYLYMMRGCHDS